MIATFPDGRRIRGGASLALLVALFGAGCATNTAPQGWLDPPDAPQVSGFGSWAEVRYHEAARTRKADGELLAVGRDSLYLMRAGSYTGIPLAGIVAVKLTPYRAPTGDVRNWTLAGVLSTASHGWWLALTAPTWIIVGTTCATSTSYEAQMTRPLGWSAAETGWRRPKKPYRSESEAAYNAESLRAYARFPQGFPPGLDRRTLLPKSPMPLPERSSRLP